MPVGDLWPVGSAGQTRLGPIDPPPQELLGRWGGLIDLPDRLQGREDRLWLMDRSGTRLVLRRLNPLLFPAQDEVVEDRLWVHRLLDEVVHAGFPAPAPIPTRDGETLVVHDGAIWELLSYLDGVEIGWRPGASLEAIGALQAQFHDTVEALASRPQRPSALPLATVAGDLSGKHTGLADVGDRLSSLLDEIGHADRRASVIHGDFTAHNVIADPRSLHPRGVIDLGLAHLEATVADIGYGLWRSGRPHQSAHWIDPTRAAAWVRGYTAQRPLDERDVRAIPVYMIGRGLQMAAKRLRAGRAHDQPLHQVNWLLTHRHELADTLARAVDPPP